MGKFQFPKINLDSVQERFKENLSGNKKKEKDPNLYVLTKDKTGSGSSVIRFLPGKTVNGKEPLPYSVIYRHTLQAEKGGSFVSCICPTTVGGRCPICEWNKMMQSDWVKSHGTYRKRKYLSNVLIGKRQVRYRREGRLVYESAQRQIHFPETLYCGQCHRYHIPQRG